jgi:hypothetical protein
VNLAVLAALQLHNTGVVAALRLYDVGVLSAVQLHELEATPEEQLAQVLHPGHNRDTFLRGAVQVREEKAEHP